MDNKNCILTHEVVERKLERMALEVVEQLSAEHAPLILIGIKENGLVIAEKMEKLLRPLLAVPLQVLSCSLDKKNPSKITLLPTIDFTNANIIVVDDVSNSGRTLLYALKPLIEFYPSGIQTLVLVERMHKKFPIKPDYVGLSVATTLQEHIQVEVENGEVTGAYLL